eukprot:4096844-Amphidinium_carterae.1
MYLIIYSDNSSDHQGYSCPRHSKGPGDGWCLPGGEMWWRNYLSFWAIALGLYAVAVASSIVVYIRIHDYDAAVADSTSDQASQRRAKRELVDHLRPMSCFAAVLNKCTVVIHTRTHRVQTVGPKGIAQKNQDVPQVECVSASVALMESGGATGGIIGNRKGSKVRKNVSFPDEVT